VLQLNHRAKKKRNCGKPQNNDNAAKRGGVVCIRRGKERKGKVALWSAREKKNDSLCTITQHWLEGGRGEKGRVFLCKKEREASHN